MHSGAHRAQTCRRGEETVGEGKEAGKEVGVSDRYDSYNSELVRDEPDVLNAEQYTLGPRAHAY